MFSTRKLPVTIFILSLFSCGCGEIATYPDTPIVNYKNFSLFKKTDDLGNSVFIGKLETRFTDGDGDIGISEPDSSIVADSLRYNFFTNLYCMNQGIFEKITGGEGEQNFRIQDISRKGQNKTLKGSIIVEFEYYNPIKYDTIFYTFYLVDKQFHRSNTDTSGIIIFTGLNF